MLNSLTFFCGYQINPMFIWATGPILGIQPKEHGSNIIKR